VDETRAALRSLLAGSASDKEFSRVAMDVNIAYALARMQGRNADVCDDLFARAGYALTFAEQIRREHGVYGIGGQDLRVSVCEAIDLWEEMVRVCSPRQIYQAEAAVIAASRAGRTRQPAV
jgi:hypothetical protein